MIKKSITFENFDGETVTEDFYFNFTAAEIAEMEVSKNGGLSEYMKRIVGTSDVKKILEVFKEIVSRSYGERSDDGKRFVKNKEIAEAFCTTEAYSQMFIEFVSDADAFAKFVSGLMPKSLALTPEEIKARSLEEMQGFNKKA